jgi:DNA replication and repair protein RecF
MELTELACERFRNLAPLVLHPHPRFNVFEGANGQGKTNLLEAIYVLATLRSFREVKAKTLIRWEASDALVRGTVRLKADLRRTLAVEVRPDGKRAALDGKVVSRLADYFGHLPVVVFGPEDLQLAKGSPTLRRRFLDRAIFNLHPVYHDEARAYQRALKHRNELLRSASFPSRPASPSHPLDPLLLDTFDEELSRRGARLLLRRLSFLGDLRPVFEATFRDITGGALEPALAYTRAAGPETDDEPALERRLRERLRDSRATDLRRAHTTQGPHADDLAIDLGSPPPRLHASQGQHRALALALKIAELQLASRLLGHPPLLLLDDVSSELDREKNAALLAFLSTLGGQVFITTTDRSWLQLAPSTTRVFRVRDGRVDLP